ncbi:MAG: hypothetical protein ACYDH3_09920 [Candidatus Aminicenantales bacterium]
MKNAAKVCLFAFTLALSSVFTNGAESKSKFREGFQTGGAIGLTSEYSPHSSAHYSSVDYNLDVHFGGYFQYNFEERLSLQLCADYLHGSCPWTFFYYSSSYISGTDPHSIFLLNLNAVFNAKRVKNLQFFFIAGGGLMTSAELDHFESNGFNLSGGPGLRLFLSSNSPSAVIFAVSFHQATYGPQFLSFSVGLEFALRVR